MKTKTKEYELVPAGSLEALHSSLKALERKLQVTVVGWALSVVVLGGLGAFALGLVREAMHPADIRARAIQIVDAAGRTRADLGVGSEGPALTFYDSAGKSRLALNVTSDGPRIALSDSFEAQRTALEISSSGVPDFTLSDSIGDQAIVMPSMVVFNKDRKLIWASPLPPR